MLVGVELETVREAYEVLVERQIQRWADEDRTGHGGTWTSSAQPRLNLRPSAADGDRGLLLDEDTAAAIEFWCHPNVQGASSQLLGVEDAGVTEMMLMCSPQKDHGPNTCHRVRRAAFFPQTPPASDDSAAQDFSAAHGSPMEGYAEDILGGGARYIQWSTSQHLDTSHLFFALVFAPFPPQVSSI